MALIESYNNVLQEELCFKIIEMFEEEEHDKGLTGSGILDETVKKTNDYFSGDWKTEKWQLIEDIIKMTLHKYIRKFYKDNSIKDISVYSNMQDGGYQIQKYSQEDGFYKVHNDFTINEKGFRVLAFIFYLNTVEEGGETEFTIHNVKIRPEQGKLVIFPACWTYPHRGCMPISSSKYIITGWIYGQLSI